MPGRRALVIGGSLGGLFAANLLHHVCGWEVDVFERVEDDLAARGAGIATHDEMFAVMRRIGLPVDESYRIEVRTRAVFGKSGAVVKEIPMLRYMSAWARFYRPLKNHFPADRYHFARTLVAVEPARDAATAIFADGSRVRADLVIGADGFRSAVRASILPELEPKYCGYIAWRGMAEEAALPPRLHAELFERHCYGLPTGEFMTIYPVPGRDNDMRRGRRRSNFVWYHPVDYERTLRELCTDAAGRCHGVAIPPHLVRPGHIADMRAAAHRVFAPQIAELVDMAEQKFFQAIFDLESPRVVEGRIALLGDAAFVARPHVGMGTTKAALDARWLCDALLACRGDVDAALGEYDAKVRRFGSRVVARGRWLGAHLEAQVTKRPEERTAHERDHMPLDILLREVGARLADIPELAELV